MLLLSVISVKGFSQGHSFVTRGSSCQDPGCLFGGYNLIYYFPSRHFLRSDLIMEMSDLGKAWKSPFISLGCISPTVCGEGLEMASGGQVSVCFCSRLLITTQFAVCWCTLLFKYLFGGCGR